MVGVKLHIASLLNTFFCLFNKGLFFIFKEGKYSKPNWKAPVELWNVQKISEQNFWFLNKSSKGESTKSEKIDEPKRREQVSVQVKTVYFCKYILWIILLKILKVPVYTKCVSQCTRTIFHLCIEFYMTSVLFWLL